MYFHCGPFYWWQDLESQSNRMTIKITKYHWVQQTGKMYHRKNSIEGTSILYYWNEIHTVTVNICYWSRNCLSQNTEMKTKRKIRKSIISLKGLNLHYKLLFI